MVRNGYNTIPTPVDQYSGQIVYRGVHDSDGVTADEFIEKLKTTSLMISGADSSSKGRGAYFSEDDFQAQMHSLRGANSKVTEWGINSKAKVLE